MTTVKKQRTCICCRNTDLKGSLMRVVKTPEGLIEFDPRGKKNGRGAYVCSVACLDKAIKTRRIDSALRTKLTQDDYERIQNQILETLNCENNRDEEN